MTKQKTIRFLQSIIAIPLFAVAMPFTGVSAIPVQIVALNQDNSAVEASLITKEEAEIDAKHAKAIDDFFSKRGAPLEGYGKKFVEEARKNDLPWNLLAAISIIESNGGKQACTGADNSVLGYGSCEMDFSSIDESIRIVSERIGGNSKYYHSEMTLSQILKKYNSVIPTYEKKVTKVMSMIEGMVNK